MSAFKASHENTAKSACRLAVYNNPIKLPVAGQLQSASLASSQPIVQVSCGHLFGLDSEKIARQAATLLGWRLLGWMTY